MVGRMRFVAEQDDLALPAFLAQQFGGLDAALPRADDNHRSARCLGSLDHLNPPIAAFAAVHRRAAPGLAVKAPLDGALSAGRQQKPVVGRTPYSPRSPSKELDVEFAPLQNLGVRRLAGRAFEPVVGQAPFGPASVAAGARGDLVDVERRTLCDRALGQNLEGCAQLPRLEAAKAADLESDPGDTGDSVRLGLVLEDRQEPMRHRHLMHAGLPRPDRRRRASRCIDPPTAVLRHFVRSSCRPADRDPRVKALFPRPRVERQAQGKDPPDARASPGRFADRFVADTRLDRDSGPHHRRDRGAHEPAQSRQSVCDFDRRRARLCVDWLWRRRPRRRHRRADAPRLPDRDARPRARRRLEPRPPHRLGKTRRPCRQRPAHAVDRDPVRIRRVLGDGPVAVQGLLLQVHRPLRRDRARAVAGGARRHARDHRRRRLLYARRPARVHRDQGP